MHSTPLRAVRVGKEAHAMAWHARNRLRTGEDRSEAATEAASLMERAASAAVSIDGRALYYAWASRWHELGGDVVSANRIAQLLSDLAEQMSPDFRETVSHILRGDAPARLN